MVMNRLLAIATVITVVASACAARAETVVTYRKIAGGPDLSSGSTC